MAALTPLLSTPSQSTVSASSCKVEFRHGNMTLENPSPELLTVLIAKWHLNRSQFGIRIDHDLASISDHSLASQSITIWHTSDH
ncbi:hypothetical protein [Escherichia coli]|uniref:hypothetical protein n=1 Tax=Escherichia coli TaxID=562 RepID=UPI0035B5DB49